VTRGALIGALVLSLVAIATAIGVSYAEYTSRQLFAERESLRAERDELLVVWRQLQLELATFAAHGRVETLARKQLGMSVPGWGEIRIIER